jgi:hydroxyacylglutathione hydrolase
MQITDRIHALKIPFQITDPSGRKVPRFVYVYLIYGKKICLIDSGVASSEKIILDYLQKTGRRPEEISQLILTHTHPDHIGAARAIKSISGCTVAAHAAEKSWIEDVDLQERERPVPGFKSLVAGSVHVDQTLQDGDLLDLDGVSMRVLHTPGHSRGSISLWLPEAGALFSADAVPVPGSMPIYQDILASVRSIQRLKSMPGIKFLLSAWDEPRLGGDAYRVMDEGLGYLQSIHHAVLKVAGDKRPDAGPDSMQFCSRVLTELGLPAAMANPLVAGSFQSSLKLSDQQNLLSDKN